MSETETETKTETKTKPRFVFVDNPTERLLSLRRASGKAPKGAPPPQEKTAIGLGLNYVRADYVSGTTELGFGMTLVDPTKIPDGLVAAAVKRCTSRQAMHAWAKIEKRPKVIELLKARLSRAPAPAAEIDRDSAEA
jgi:hypothetical protein